jgi:hypothetical protein
MKVASHVDRVWSGGFRYSTSQNNFQDFMGELIYNFLLKNIIIHPRLVQEILQGHENYHLAIDDNLHKINQLLHLALLFHVPAEHDTEEEPRVRCRQRDQLHCYWALLMDLAKFFQSQFPDLGVCQLRLNKSYCAFFQSKLDVPLLSQKKLALNISDYFNQNLPLINFKKLVQNNPIFAKCSLFLKKTKSELDLEMIKVLTKTLKFWKVQYMEFHKAHKICNTQQTHDDYDDFQILSEKDVFVLGYVDRLENLFYERPRSKKLVMFYLKVFLTCRFLILWKKIREAHC